MLTVVMATGKVAAQGEENAPWVAQALVALLVGVFSNSVENEVCLPSEECMHHTTFSSF